MKEIIQQKQETDYQKPNIAERAINSKHDVFVMARLGLAIIKVKAMIEKDKLGLARARVDEMLLDFERLDRIKVLRYAASGIDALNEIYKKDENESNSLKEDALQRLSMFYPKK